MNIKKLNEELEKYLESSLPDISKMDKICDLDKHYSESGRYIGRRNSKWNIYKYVRTSRKFNGGYNYDYKAISPDFDTYDEAYTCMLLLNSESVQNFLYSISFQDAKRPYTKKVLQRIDLLKCVQEVSIEELKKTEKTFNLQWRGV